jgi:hypothetical protein
MQVPTLDLGELLIRCIYQAQPQLEPCSQAQLLQLVTLADNFGAAAVADLAGEQLQLLAADPGSELEWDTAMRIYSLPPGCPELDTFKHLFFAAARRVMQELHDLENACQESNMRKLLQLPQLALLHLLNNRQTCVASENTVIYVIQSWALAQQQQPSLLEMQQLCSLIRIGNCSALYLSAVLGAWPLLAQCFSPQEHALACMLASSNRATQQQKLPAILQAAEQSRVHNARMARLELQQTQMMLEGNSIIRSRPVWLQSARPGAAEEYNVEFEIQVSWVEDLVNDALAKARAAAAAAVEGEEFEETLQWQVPSWKGRSYAFGFLAVASTAPTAPPAAAAAAAPAVRRHAGEVRQAAAVAGVGSCSGPMHHRSVALLEQWRRFLHSPTSLHPFREACKV